MFAILARLRDYEKNRSYFHEHDIQELIIFTSIHNPHGPPGRRLGPRGGIPGTAGGWQRAAAPRPRRRLDNGHNGPPTPSCTSRGRRVSIAAPDKNHPTPDPNPQPPAVSPLALRNSKGWGPPLISSARGSRFFKRLTCRPERKGPHPLKNTYLHCDWGLRDLLKYTRDRAHITLEIVAFLFKISSK